MDERQIVGGNNAQNRAGENDAQERSQRLMQRQHGNNEDEPDGRIEVEILSGPADVFGAFFVTRAYARYLFLKRGS